MFTEGLVVRWILTKVHTSCEKRLIQCYVPCGYESVPVLLSIWLDDHIDELANNH